MKERGSKSGTATLADNEPGEKYFSHIHDGYVRVKETLCGRPRRKDLSSMGTHIYSAMHEDVCTKCREVFENEYVVTRRKR